MPGNHGEITVVEQNRADNRANNKQKKKKKKKEEDGVEDESQLLIPSISKHSKGCVERLRKKHKSRSGSCKGGCFSVMRQRRTEEEEGSASDPNDESFTGEMMRVMLQTNDFFSDDCNPHR